MNVYENCGVGERAVGIDCWVIERVEGGGLDQLKRECWNFLKGMIVFIIIERV